MSGLLLELVDKLCGAIVSLPLALIYVFLWDRQRAKRRWGWMTLLVLYLSAMYIVIGVPGIQYITWEPTINWVPFRDFTPSNLRGMALNAVMFAPLGFLLPAYFEGFRRWNTTLAAGFATSLAIECIQLFTSRATDVDDLIMNTLGALAGFVVYLAFDKVTCGKLQLKDVDARELPIFVIVMYLGRCLLFNYLGLMNLWLGY